MEDSHLAAELGRRLRDLRLKAGISQRELGRRLGQKAPVPRTRLSRLEAGRAGVPRLVTIVGYLNACNEPIGRFFLELAQDGAFGTKEEPVVIAPPSESAEAKRETARARARETRRIRKHEARELVSRLEDEIAPVVRPYLVGGQAFRMGAYVQAARAFYRAGKRLIGPDGTFAPASVLKVEFDAIESQNPDWLLNPQALRQVRLEVERLLRNEAQAARGK